MTATRVVEKRKSGKTLGRYLPAKRGKKDSLQRFARYSCGFRPASPFMHWIRWSLGQSAKSLQAVRRPPDEPILLLF